MSIKICPKCGGKVSTERNLCIHCGYVFPSLKKCPDCGQSCPLEAKECPECGHPFDKGIVDPVALEGSAEPQGKEEAPTDEENPIEDKGSDVSEMVSQTPEEKEEKPRCPYCHGEELMELGKGYYLCLTCKMRFLDIEGKASDVTYSAPITGAGEDGPKDAPREENGTKEEAGPETESPKGSGDGKKKERTGMVFLFVSIGVVVAGMLSILIPCVFVPIAQSAERQREYSERMSLWEESWRIEESLSEESARIESSLAEERQQRMENVVSNWSESEKERFGAAPVLDSSSGTLTYGIYPQTKVSSSYIVDQLDSYWRTLPEKNGMFYLDGELYAKAEARPYYSDYSFDDGSTIYDGETYWFQCEPITWKILSSENGEYSLVSTVLLDAHRYDDDDSASNNYKNSEIREWLNGDFYDTAFSFGDSSILTTHVDNSASTTDDEDNPYACSDTWDKVYLLSYQDYCNTEYFADYEARQCKTTDWARANYAYCSTDSSYLYNGWYWTRSPDSNGSSCAWGVYRGGGLYGSIVSYAGNSVRPSLRITVA